MNDGRKNDEWGTERQRRYVEKKKKKKREGGGKGFCVDSHMRVVVEYIRPDLSLMDV